MEKTGENRKLDTYLKPSVCFYNSLIRAKIDVIFNEKTGKIKFGLGIHARNTGLIEKIKKHAPAIKAIISVDGVPVELRQYLARPMCVDEYDTVLSMCRYTSTLVRSYWCGPDSYYLVRYDLRDQYKKYKEM